jgi:hypothetical protein
LFKATFQAPFLSAIPMSQEFKASGTIAVVVQRFVKAKLLLNEASDSWVRRGREVGTWQVNLEP